MVNEIIVFGIQKRHYREAVDNLLIVLIGDIPITMSVVLYVTMAIGSRSLSQHVSKLANDILFGILISCLRS